MLDARKAREETKTRINQLAREFITNIVDDAVAESINDGYFYATVTLDGVENPEAVGLAVVRILESTYGYKAEFNCCTESPKVVQHIKVSWEEEEKDEPHCV